MIQGQGETWGVLRRSGRFAGRRLAPGVARKAALLIAVWVACVCTAGAGNMIVTFKEREQTVEATQVLFENGSLRIVPASGPATKYPASAILRIVPKNTEGASETEKLREENEKLRQQTKKLDETLKARELRISQLTQALNSDASLDKEMTESDLRRTVKDLEKAKDLLTSETKRLQSELDAKKAALQALTAPPEPNLEMVGTTLTTTTLKSVARVRGEVRNKDQVPYSRVVLEVLVRNSAGNPVGKKTYTFVTGLDPGAARSFAADLELTPGEGMKSEVTAVAARTTGGEWRR
jgi:hypothetical protein